MEFKRLGKITKQFLRAINKHILDLKSGKAENIFEVQDILLHIHPAHLRNTIKEELKRPV